METYRNIYPNSLTDGIGLISTLSALPAIPWNILSDEVKADLERAYNIRSGFKMVIDSFTLGDVDNRAKLLAAMFSQKWKRLWDIYALEYNLLDAYKVTESGHRKTTTNGSVTDDYGRTVTEAGTDTGTVNTSGSDTINSTDSIFGFNSADAVPSDTGTETNNSSSLETRNLSNNRSITNAGQDKSTTANEDNEEYGYTKTGNIGYTSPQELIKQDIEIWSNPYFNMVFDDIDMFMTVSVY